MSWRKELGRQISNARDAAGMTQQELSRLADVSRQMISRYETGQDVPVIDVLATLAEVLETDFRVLGYRINCEPISHHRAPHLSPEQLELEFEKPRKFPGATIEITPRKGRILIRADIPA